LAQWKDINSESKDRWETNAEFWDDYMGDESNRFHRELIRPYTEELLQIKQGHAVMLLVEEKEFSLTKLS
jgi:hypothetical protein